MKVNKVVTVTKRELVNQISENLQIKQVIVKDIVQQFLDDIVTYLSKGERLEFRDFGVFEVVDRKERIAQNPKTLEKVLVPGRKVVKFKVGQTMKEIVRKNLEESEKRK
jgi:nucleoid DNA-binding protein